jgi:CotS family spore coat protein
MMDTIKHKLLTSLETCRSFPDALPRQSWEYYHGVYLIHGSRLQSVEEKRNPGPPVVLKRLRLGAVKAYLTGKLLDEGQKYFGRIQPREQIPSIAENPTVCDAILPAPAKISGGMNYLWSRGNRYLLTSLIKGRQADYRRRSDLRAAIRTMNMFHRFTHQLISENQKLWAFLRFNIKLEWHKRLREMEICRDIASRLLGQGIHEEWCRRYLAYWPEFYEQAQETTSAMETLVTCIPENSRDDGDVICYHDWAYHNVIIGGRKPGGPQASLIDFDDMIVDRPTHDRANLMSRYLRLNRWSPTSLNQILQDFDRFYPWRPDELKWLRIYLAFPYEFWMLARQFFIEKQPWSMKYYQDQWERKIACRVQRKLVLEMLESSVDA